MRRFLMQLTIEMSPEDLINIQQDLFTKNLDSESFLKREIIERGRMQNEMNITETCQFSQLYEEFDSADLDKDVSMFEGGSPWPQPQTGN
jgi:hypothetical protein